jgi:hypothetical protein
MKEMKKRWKDAVEECARHMGNHRMLAEALGLSSTATWRWSKVPDKRVIEVARLTGIPLRELRPDLYENIKDIL